MTITFTVIIVIKGYRISWMQSCLFCSRLTNLRKVGPTIRTLGTTEFIGGPPHRGEIAASGHASAALGNAGLHAELHFQVRGGHGPGAEGDRLGCEVASPHKSRRGITGKGF